MDTLETDSSFLSRLVTWDDTCVYYWIFEKQNEGSTAEKFSTHSLRTISGSSIVFFYLTTRRKILQLVLSIYKEYPILFQLDMFLFHHNSTVHPWTFCLLIWEYIQAIIYILFSLSKYCHYTFIYWIDKLFAIY